MGDGHCAQEIAQGKYIRLTYTRIQHASKTIIRITFKEPTKKYRQNIPRRSSLKSRENRREMTA